MTERYAGVQIQGIRIDSQQGPAHEHALPEGRPGWGFVLWLIGYALGIMLFAFVRPSLIGWIITPFGTAVLRADARHSARCRLEKGCGSCTGRRV